MSIRPVAEVADRATSSSNGIVLMFAAMAAYLGAVTGQLTERATGGPKARHDSGEVVEKVIIVALLSAAAVILCGVIVAKLGVWEALIK